MLSLNPIPPWDTSVVTPALLTETITKPSTKPEQKEDDNAFIPKEIPHTFQTMKRYPSVAREAKQFGFENR